MDHSVHGRANFLPWELTLPAERLVAGFHGQAPATNL